MKIRSFEIGVEAVTQVARGEEAHLPREGALAPAFLPQPQALDAILRRPSLDERLPALLQPEALDPTLLDPASLSEARLLAAAGFAEAAEQATGHARRILARAAVELENAVMLNDEVRAALAALLRG